MFDYVYGFENKKKNVIRSKVEEGERKREELFSYKTVLFCDCCYCCCLPTHHSTLDGRFDTGSQLMWNPALIYVGYAKYCPIPLCLWIKPLRLTGDPPPTSTHTLRKIACGDSFLELDSY